MLLAVLTKIKKKLQPRDIFILFNFMKCKVNNVLLHYITVYKYIKHMKHKWNYWFKKKKNWRTISVVLHLSCLWVENPFFFLYVKINVGLISCEEYFLVCTYKRSYYDIITVCDGSSRALKLLSSFMCQKWFTNEF